jgi:hypothetical protein
MVYDLAGGYDTMYHTHPVYSLAGWGILCNTEFTIPP